MQQTYGWMDGRMDAPKVDTHVRKYDVNCGRIPPLTIDGHVRVTWDGYQMPNAKTGMTLLRARCVYLRWCRLVHAVFVFIVLWH